MGVNQTGNNAGCAKVMANPQRHRMILRDAIQGVTKHAIRRVARRGGGGRADPMTT